MSISDELLLRPSVVPASRELATVPDGGVRPTVPVFDGGTGPRPGLDLTSMRALSEVLDEDLDLDALK